MSRVGTTPINLEVARPTPHASADFDPSRAVDWLQRGDVDRAMRYVVGAFSRDRAPAPGAPNSPQWRQLTQLLSDSPWVDAVAPRRCRNLVSPTPTGHAIHQWMLQHSDTFRVVGLRDRYLAKQIDASAAREARAPVAAVFSRQCDAISMSAAWSAGQLHAVHVSGDPAAAAAIRASEAPGSCPLRHASLQGILAGQFRLYGCGLIYLSDLPTSMEPATLGTLLDALSTWLKVRGQLIVAAFTRAPESRFLHAVAGWQPVVATSDSLLQLAREIDQVKAFVHCQHSDGLAFLHLERR